MEKLDAGETMRRLEAAVEEARAFYGIDPLYILDVRAASMSRGQAACIDAGDPYRRCTIDVDFDYYQENPELIRRDMAHEVAHLMSNELIQLWRRMPEEWQNRDAPQGGMLHDAIETLTIRLERLFLRERQAPTT